MCGIAGYITKNQVDEKVLIKMRDALSHRGPDDAGIFISADNKVGLAHRRLSILDLSPAGHQPMSSADEKIWITFNGEIYNFLEIRKELENKGQTFKSNGDTEVIIYAYKEFGTGCLEKFNGMFSFVIYDSSKNQLFFARDRFGIKPFHYGFLPNGDFVFASEIKAIVQHPNFQKEIDYGALGDYFKYRYIPSPRTIWKSIKKLPHGHLGILNLDNFDLKIEKYYDLPEKIIGQPNSSIEQVEELIKDAVKKRLISDVEVGTFLSGGIDSSSISYFANKEHEKIKSFSIGFMPEKYSELEDSEIVAEFLGTSHITKVIENVEDDIGDQLSYTYDEPHADSSNIPTYLLSKMTSENVKVALSGDGGDEIFAGYRWYRQYLLDSKIEKIKALFGTGQSISEDFENYYNKLLLNRFDENKFKNLFAPEIYNQVKNNENLFEKYLNAGFKNIRQIQFIDLNTFMADDILSKVDRASMAHALEVRVPFLDYRLVEAVFRLPQKDFPDDSYGKPILKKIMKNKLPKRVLSKRKKGFSAPVTQWPFYGRINQILLSGRAVEDGIIRKDFIQDLLDNKYENSAGMLWMAYIFEKWYQKWFI
ncbi:MAG: asparagine synthase (glutamine-hydrolyzing) [Patescibacteria group bacterium]